MSITALMRPMVLSLVLVLGLSACVTNQTGPKEQLGGLLGAAAGGYIGSTIGKGDGRLAATAAGAVIGGVIGSDLGRTQDKVDRAEARNRQATVVYPTHPVPKKRKAKRHGRSLPPVHDDYDYDVEGYDDDYPY